MMNTKMEKVSMTKFRRTFCAGLLLFLLTCGETFAVDPVTVSNAADLANYITSFNAGNSYDIVVSGTITLSSELPKITGTGTNTLTITASTSGGTINGNGFRGLYIDSGNDNTASVKIDGVSFTNCVALGGNGGSGLVGGGGGMGAGGAIFVASGKVTLKDVVTQGNGSNGGNGGNVLQESKTYAGGGGMGGDGGSGSVGDAKLYPNGNTASGGGLRSDSDGSSTGGTTAAVGGEGAAAHYDYSESTTGLIGGGGANGGGGGGSLYKGGNGGLGAGGGAGLIKSGSGGFGGGGAGGSSSTTAGLNGEFGGNGGYVANTIRSDGSVISGGGTGGGGAALGGALYIESGAKVSIEYTKDTTLSDNYTLEGAAGSVLLTGATGGATAGSAAGTGYFFKNNLSLNIESEKTFTVDNTIYGYGDAKLIKEGEGTIQLDSNLTLTGNTEITEGLLNVGENGTLGRSSTLVIRQDGDVSIHSDQIISDLQGEEGGTIDLNGYTLKIQNGYTGTDPSAGYAGTITSSDPNNAGTLYKDGKGVLRLTGDNSASAFTTKIAGGSVSVNSGNALGSGDIHYIRTDMTDDTAALIFANPKSGENSIELSNNIILDGNNTGMLITSENNSTSLDKVILSGKISTKSNSTGVISVNLNQGDQILALTNTGVSSTGGVSTYDRTTANSFSELKLYNGSLNVKTDSVNDVFFSALGGAVLSNHADGTANSFLLDSSEDLVYFNNTVNLESGYLSVKNNKAGQDLQFGGNVSGIGGLEVDLNASDDLLALTGSVDLGATGIVNGVLDISAANGTTSDSTETAESVYKKTYKTTNLGLLTAAAADSAVVNVGEQILYVGSDSDGDYYGTITGALKEVLTSGSGSSINYSFSGNTYASIVKTGSGTWGLSLKDNAGYVSNVRDITVNAGAVKIIDNSTSGLNYLLNGADTSLVVAAKDNVALNGKIQSASGKTTKLVIELEDPSKTVSLSNHGVESGVYHSADDNSFSQVVINKGNLSLTTEKASFTNSAGQTNSAFFSSIAGAKIINNGDSNTSGRNTLSLTAVGSETADLYFDNNFDLASGLLTIKNTAGQNMHFGGSLSGKGGFELDLNGSTEKLYLSGKVAVGAVAMTNGILDLTKANSAPITDGTDAKTIYNTGYGYTSLGNLTSTTKDISSTAQINVGKQYLYVGSNEDGSFYGTITGDIQETVKNSSGYEFTGNKYTSILKTGSGNWTLWLNDASNVRDINVKEGTLTMNDHTDADLKNIYVTTGTLQVNDSSLRGVNINMTNGTLHVNKNTVDGKVTLGKLNSESGSSIMIDQDATLALDNANSSYLIAGKLIAGSNGAGTLEFNGNYDYQTAGYSSAKQWTLSGASNQWTGTVRINDGTVLLANSYAAGNEAATVVLGNSVNNTSGTVRTTVNGLLGHLVIDNDSTVQIDKGVTTTIAGSLEGSKDLTISYDSSQSNGGILLLKSGIASGYTGDITVNRSVLKLTGDNRGTHGLTLKGGSLVMDYKGMTYADSITEVDSLWNNDEIIVTGTGGGIEISGTTKTVNIANDLKFESDSSDLEFQLANSNTVRWSGSFNNSDKASFYKYGLGKLILDGDPSDAESQFLGDFIVNAGTLQLGADNATMANNQLSSSDVTIGSAGSLTGRTSGFNSLNVSGNLNVDTYNATSQKHEAIKLNALSGNAFTMNSGSSVNLYAANKTNYQSIESVNNAGMVFNGGSVKLTVDDKTDIGDSTAFKSFVTTGTISGNLSKLKLYDNISGYQLVARKSSTGVDLVFVHANMNYRAAESNGLAVGEYLTNSINANLNGNAGLSEMFENAIYNSNNFQERMSGSSQLSSGSAQVMNLNMLRNAVTGQIIPYSSDSFGKSTLRGQSRSGCGLTGWVSGYGATGSMDGQISVANADLSSWGTVIGVELGANETAQGGLFFSYGNSKMDNNVELGSLTMDNKIFGGYFRWNDSFGYGMVYGNAGWTDYENNRQLDAVDMVNRFQSDYKGVNWNIYGERGYSFEFARCALQPYLGLQYTSIQQDAYQENGENQYLNLVLSDMTLDSLQTSLGIRLVTKTGGRANGFVYADWQHELLDTAFEGTAQLAGFQNYGTSYRLVGSSFGRDWFMAGLGGQFQYNTALDFFGSFDLQTNEYSSMVTGNGGVRYSW